MILVDLSLYSGASDGVAAPTPVEPPSLPFEAAFGCDLFPRGLPSEVKVGEVKDANH